MYIKKDKKIRTEAVSINEIRRINKMNETLLCWRNYFPPFIKKLS